MSSMRVMNPRLRWFTAKMQKKLRQNIHKSDLTDIDQIRRGLQSERMELDRVLAILNQYDGLSNSDEYVKGLRREAILECADEANFLMILANRLRKDTTHE